MAVRVRVKIVGAVRISVRAGDRDGPSAVAGVLVSETDDECILSDTLVEQLAIVPLRPGKGIWRFMDEAVERPSEPLQTW
jgi:hypothetical protein